MTKYGKFIMLTNSNDGMCAMIDPNKIVSMVAGEYQGRQFTSIYIGRDFANNVVETIPEIMAAAHELWSSMAGAGVFQPFLMQAAGE